MILEKKKEYDGNRVHLSMAGSGNPWSAFTKYRKRILRELHDCPNLDELGTYLETTPEMLRAELQPLINASLVSEHQSLYRPTFLITDETETLRVFEHACDFGLVLANRTETSLKDLKDAFTRLDLSTQFHFEDLAFLFVGGRILDIKLLEKLTQGARIMPPAPQRPSPDRPDARFYFYMVEGEPEHLGKYGLEDMDLPWKSWHYYSFGLNLIDGSANTEREEMQARCKEILDFSIIDGPESLAQELGLPIIHPTDSKIWSDASNSLAEVLKQCYLEEWDSIQALHSMIESGKYAPNSLGEFVCWYAHIAYCSAIDSLESKGIIRIPQGKYQAAIWHREQEREGLLV